MRISTAKDLGSAIRHRRRSLGMRQAALAARIGITRQWIVALESGKPGTAVSTYLLALKVLDLELALREPPPAGGGASAEGQIETLDIDLIVERATLR